MKCLPRLRGGWLWGAILGCCLLAFSACDDEFSKRDPLALSMDLGFFSEFSGDRGVVDPGVYVGELSDEDGDIVATMEIELLADDRAQYRFVSIPLFHLALRPGTMVLRLDSIEPPNGRHFRALELGTLFGLGTGPEKPLTVEFLDAEGERIGEPLVYDAVPNNSSHPEQIDPLRVSPPKTPAVPAEIRVSTPFETLVPIVFFTLVE